VLGRATSAVLCPQWFAVSANEQGVESNQGLGKNTEVGGSCQACRGSDFSGETLMRKVSGLLLLFWVTPRSQDFRFHRGKPGRLDVRNLKSMDIGTEARQENFGGFNLVSVLLHLVALHQIGLSQGDVAR
jgi:hypothetical protein